MLYYKILGLHYCVIFGILKTKTVWSVVMMQAKGPLSNQSTEKALAIIEYLVSRSEPVRLNEISRDLSINASTTLRFLTTLQNCGYVFHDADTFQYSLSYKICRLANKFSVNMELRDITHPYLIQLTDIFQESACVSVEQNMEMVYVDVMSGPGKVLMGMQRVGNTSPMHSTGNGKLLLLNYTEEQIDQLIEKRGLPRFTNNTLTDKAALQRRLEEVRQKGYATDEEENEIGLRCVAYPIYDYTDKIIAGLSITGPSSRITEALMEERGHYLKKAAKDISRRLGYQIE